MKSKLRNRRKHLTILAAVAAPLLAAAQAGAQAQLPAPSSPLVGAFCSSGAAITGVGSSFALNAHLQAFEPAYAAACNKGTITYVPSGSGAGKLATQDRTAAFGGTDDPLTINEEAVDVADLGSNPQHRVSALHHIPLAIGAVTVSYNLSSCGVGQQQLQLRSQEIGLIFSGAITKWDDPVMVQQNPVLARCAAKPIKLVVRSDVSGTTFAFKDYLSKRNPQFIAYKQSQENTAWPAQDLNLNTPLRAKGNGGVASLIATTDGAIGYVDLSTAERKGLTWANVDGPHLQFEAPQKSDNSANCDQAALGAVLPPSTLSPGWDTVSITDSPNPNAYPICALTYALIYNDLGAAYAGTMNSAQIQTLVDYIGIAVDDAGQKNLPGAGYARLPVNIQAEAKAGLASVNPF